MDPGAAVQRYFPRRVDIREQPTLIASSRVPSRSSSRQTNVFQSCSVCANGAVALTTSEDRALGVYSLPIGETETNQLPPAKRFVQSGNILGTLWYPTAMPEVPSSFCFLASVRECPVRLLDASDGRLRASYRIVDHRERQIAPHSMAFNSATSKLYCGFQDAIEVFDINYPGEGERIFTTPSKKSKSGLKGIISALAFCPDYSGLYAAGTFSSSLVLFAESNQSEIIQSLGGINGPVTQVKFNPMQPHLLYATSRQTNSILAWDIRGDTSAPYQELKRSGLTNQRLSFDVDAFGTTIVTGDKDGFISCFELDGETPEEPTLKYKAHNDAVAAAVFHPLEAQLVSVSGSRHFDNDMSEEDSTSSNSSDVEPTGSEGVRQQLKPYPFSRDTSIKLWGFPARPHIDYQPEETLLTQQDVYDK